ncbi:MAG TPA: hypothetical protein VEX64_08300, partial [Pyrinomonadaceae bacterium]|nr:hypothetical protein [Pyrinomonadaceae bacterium]
MRRGAGTTTRALSEQSTASEQVSREATRLTTMIAGVTRGMSEQAAASRQISIAATSMRRQSDQVTKALTEQTRAMREMTSASNDVAKQIKLITGANVEHSIVADNILQMLSETRRITDRNAQGVETTLIETNGLIEQAQEIAVIMNGLNIIDGNGASEVELAKDEKTRGRSKKAKPEANGAGENGSQSK